MQAYPFNALNVRYLLHKFSNALLLVQVDAVECKFLCNYLELLYAFGNKITHLVENLFHWTRLVCSCNYWNCTICTTAATSFRNFQVCIMSRGCQHSLLCNTFVVFLFEVIYKFCPVEFTIELVDLRNLFAKFCQITFRQASHYIQFFKVSLFLTLTKLKNHIYGFLLCVANETTGVNYRNFTTRLIAVVCNLVATLLQLTHKMLRIDKIL